MAKRALILAGGGMKVAFQGGVLQVWLDEAGVGFDVYDGASGGVFNLAMVCQGYSGSEIAERWRAVRPALGVAPNLARLVRLYWASSSYTFWSFRRAVLRRAFRLDWDAIRASNKDATFDVYDFTDHELKRLRPCELTEDLLLACVSLPKLFPPVRVDGHVYVDSVYATDADLIGAIERGADELWVIWTVSMTGRWTVGYPHSYFRIVEQAANSRFKADLARIEHNNRELAEGRPGEFGRRIDVRLLRAEVPMHYVVVLRKKRILAAVEQGVAAARQWCEENGVPYEASPPPGGRSFSFHEAMVGGVSFGDGERLPCEVRLQASMDDVSRFIADPNHQARLTGHVVCPALGGERPVERGRMNQFVGGGEKPRTKTMRYRLFFRDAAGNPLTLVGVKTIGDAGLHPWRDTTRLATRIYPGHVESEGRLEPLARGELRLTLRAFLRELASFQPPLLYPRTMRFAVFFSRSVWSSYL
jgi:predicted acylesterase/phospholipase RssA